MKVYVVWYDGIFTKTPECVFLHLKDAEDFVNECQEMVIKEFEVIE